MPNRIEKLASNSTMYYRGDTCLEISPFTNYYMFTIFRESDDERVDNHIPLNLTNLGTIYLSFISGETKIRIPNYTDAENVDMANGEVVFRIAESEASRILALTNKTFYVSSAITDGKTSSDETVLFSGSWNEYSAAMRSSLTETIQSLNETINDLRNQIAIDTDSWTVKLADAENKNDLLKAENEKLSAQIIELENKLAEARSSSGYIEANILSEVLANTGTSAGTSTSPTETNYNKIPAEVKENDTQDVRYKADLLMVSSLKSTFKQITDTDDTRRD